MASQFIPLFWDKDIEEMSCCNGALFISAGQVAREISDGSLECDQVIEIDLEAGTSRDVTELVGEILYEDFRDGPRGLHSETAAEFINTHTLYEVRA